MVKVRGASRAARSVLHEFPLPVLGWQVCLILEESVVGSGLTGMFLPTNLRAVRRTGLQSNMCRAKIPA